MTSPVHLVHIHGLVVSSPVPLAGSSASPRTPDVWVQLVDGPVAVASDDPVLQVDEPARQRHYSLGATADGWDLVFPGAMSFSLNRSLDAVLVRVREGVVDGLLSVLLSGPVLTVLALLRGHFMLHASAIAWESSPAGRATAVAFFGPAGSGKSSIARLLARQGRVLLTDDALRLDVSAGAVTAWRGTTSSRLRSLGGPTSGGTGDETVSGSADGRVVVSSSADVPVQAEAGLLARLLLSPSFEAPSIRTMSPMEATVHLASNWPIEGVRDPRWHQSRLAAAAALTARVRVVEFAMPWQAGALGEGSKALRNRLGEQVAVMLRDAVRASG